MQNTKKKLTYTSKQQIIPPIEVDELQVSKAILDFDGQAEIRIALMDGPKVIKERSVVMGMKTLGISVDLDAFEQGVLDAVRICGIVPSGGKVEDK